ncbi:MAG: S8/S53 family peptidase [Gammaproteobacteria bacterium]|nr:S8/S53 family peptidase [Gammaproteobacteria bacterium]
MQLIDKSRMTLMLVLIFGFLSANAHAQQVALLDSGVDPEAGYNLAQGFNYFLNIENTEDVSTREDEGHGTVSARLISESFSGPIVPFVINDGTGDRFFEDQVRVARDSALSDILGRDAVDVIAITTGTPGTTGAAAPLIPDLSADNKVIVIMAGNEFGAQPNALSSTSFNLSGVIIVGGTYFDGVLLPQANRAGTTANKYVAAIGMPTLDDSLGVNDGGSSWAAARIAGIAGGVLQQNPNLTAAEVVNVILESAEDRGEAGTDSEYGRGFILDAEQVLNNIIGPPVVPVEPTPTPTPTGGGGGGGGGAGLLLGGALAGALLLMRKPKTKLEKTLVLDSYGRAFQIDLSNHIHINDGSLHLDDFFLALDQTSVSDGFILPELNTQVAFGASTNVDHRMDMIEYFAMPGDVVIEDQQADMSIAIRSQLSNQLELTAGYQVNPSQFYGAAAQMDSHEVFGNTSFISGQAFDSVLSGFSPQAQVASVSYQPGKLDQASLKLGLVSVDQSQRFGQNSFSTILEGGFQFNDNAGLSLQFGEIEERGSLFGGAAGGIFGVDTATTYALNLAARIRMGERFSIIGNYGMARTNVDASGNSLLKDFSGLRSDWYSMGLVANDLFRDHDQMGVAFSQPLKIRSGSVDYSIPIGRSPNGNIAFDRERINLSETGATEHALEGYYRTMLTEKLELGNFVSFRQNPNHVSDGGDELLFMATLRYRQ